MHKQDFAQLLAGFAIVALTFALAIVGRKDWVASVEVTYDQPPDATGAATTQTIGKGAVIPAADVERVDASKRALVRRSWLGAILAGSDHRVSTSKTVAFAWTLAVAFGLLSLLIAVWLGDHAPWDLQVAKGLQEEYLLLLGGPYAAAVLAKYATTNQEASKTPAAVGTASTSQLFSNDDGNTDLGDFQYVLFNAIGLAFFLGDFASRLDKGFPDLPPILTGLVLTSAGGYAAKKLIANTVPAVTSVLPTSAVPGASVQVFGTNLTVPATASDTGSALVPTVLMGSRTATVTAHDLVLGNDRLTVTVPVAPAGSAPVTVARADGAPARGPAGANAVAFEILAADAPGA